MVMLQKKSNINLNTIKMKNQFKKNVLKILFILFFISSLNAQNYKSNFEIKFCLDRNRISLESENGSNWNSLWVKSNSFNLNQNGMIDIVQEKDEYENSKYVFTIIRKGKKITLIGKKGTEWKELFFEIPEKGTYVIVTENGIKAKS
jgi:hypothetical protein